MTSTPEISGHWLGSIKTWVASSLVAFTMYIIDRALPRLRYKGLATCLENEAQVLSPFCRSLQPTNFDNLNFLQN